MIGTTISHFRILDLLGEVATALPQQYCRRLEMMTGIVLTDSLLRGDLCIRQH